MFDDNLEPRTCNYEDVHPFRAARYWVRDFKWAEPGRYDRFATPGDGDGLLQGERDAC